PAGPQPRCRMQASSGQMARAMRVEVQVMKRTAAIVYELRSRSVLEGSRFMKRSHVGSLSSWTVLRIWNRASAAEMNSSEVERIAIGTWMAIQYESSAGISFAAGV